MIQCQLFTKVTWNVSSMKSTSGIYGEEDEYMYGQYGSSASPREYENSNDQRYQGYYSNDPDEKEWR